MFSAGIPALVRERCLPGRPGRIRPVPSGRDCCVDGFTCHANVGPEVVSSDVSVSVESWVADDVAEVVRHTGEVDVTNVFELSSLSRQARTLDHRVGRRVGGGLVLGVVRPVTALPSPGPEAEVPASTPRGSTAVELVRSDLERKRLLRCTVVGAQSARSRRRGRSRSRGRSSSRLGAARTPSGRYAGSSANSSWPRPVGGAERGSSRCGS